MSDKLRKKYWRALELPSGPASSQNNGASNVAVKPSGSTPHEKALTRAYALRTFEIEHYWKRATYFWGFQVAIFAAFGLLWKEGSPGPWHPIAIALSALGCLTAVANILSAKGSKFWQTNWERHIDMLEDEVEGRLHKTVWLDNGKVAYSVSRINQTLGWCFVTFWLIVLAYSGHAYSHFRLPDWVALPSWAADKANDYVAVILTMTVVGIILLYRQTTNLQASLPEQDGAHGLEMTRTSKWHRRLKPQIEFVMRYAPGEPPKAEKGPSSSGAGRPSP